MTRKKLFKVLALLPFAGLMGFSKKPDKTTFEIGIKPVMPVLGDVIPTDNGMWKYRDGATCPKGQTLHSYVHEEIEFELDGKKHRMGCAFLYNEGPICVWIDDKLINPRSVMVEQHKKTHTLNREF